MTAELARSINRSLSRVAHNGEGRAILDKLGNDDYPIDGLEAIIPANLLVALAIAGELVDQNGATTHSYLWCTDGNMEDYL